MEEYTVEELNQMTMVEIWDLYSDPGEDEVRIEGWDEDLPRGVYEAWTDWAREYVADNANEIAQDGFIGINERTDLDIYRQLRNLGFYGPRGGE